LNNDKALSIKDIAFHHLCCNAALLQAQFNRGLDLEVRVIEVQKSSRPALFKFT